MLSRKPKEKSVSRKSKGLISLNAQQRLSKMMTKKCLLIFSNEEVVGDLGEANFNGLVKLESRASGEGRFS